MNVYDNEESVNFVMAPPVEGKNALPHVPDQPAAAGSRTGGRPRCSAARAAREVAIVSSPAVPATLHLTTHLPTNKFCDGTELKQKPTRRRWGPEMVEKPELWGPTFWKLTG